MKLCSTAELREKEVINLCDGMRLGYATDFEIEICEAKIVSIIIPAETGFFGFPKGDSLIIPWEKIECIGEDTILVKIPAGELLHCQTEKKKKKNSCFKC